MARIEHVRHLAEQIRILTAIADGIRMACEIAAAGPLSA
jgi:hypothetical protein